MLSRLSLWSLTLSFKSILGVIVFLTAIGIILFNTISALNFLPHQKMQQPFLGKPITHIIPTPTAVPALSAEATPEARVQNFLTIHLQPAYLATNPATVKFTKIKNGSYSFSWARNPGTQESINGLLTATFYSDATFDATIRVHTRQSQPTLTQTSADFLMHHYFIIPEKLSWQCSTNTPSPSCVSTLVDQNVKIGFIVYSVPQLNDNIFLLSCFITSNNPLYNTNNVCLIP